jgi:hypothetical protein
MVIARTSRQHTDKTEKNLHIRVALCKFAPSQMEDESKFFVHLLRFIPSDPKIICFLFSLLPPNGVKVVVLWCRRASEFSSFGLVMLTD